MSPIPTLHCPRNTTVSCRLVPQAQRAQQGAALLLAMLIMTLVATVTVSGLWLQWQSVEVERSERFRQQLTWLMAGAFDWSRVILREDSRNIDHLGEPWAIPLKEVRLSTFLSRDNVLRDGDPDVVFSGAMQDEQSKINLNGLIDQQTHDTQVKIWERLFRLLELPQTEWRKILIAAQFERAARSGQADPAADKDKQLLWPQRSEDLVWLGLSGQTMDRLLPFVTVLPNQTPVNVNTASAEVLYAVLGSIDWGQAQNLLRKRANAPWKEVQELEKELGLQSPLDSKTVGVKTDFFALTGQLKLEDLQLQETALVTRKTSVPTLLWTQQRVPPLRMANAPNS